MRMRPSIVAIALIAGTSAAAAQESQTSQGGFHDPNFLGKLLGKMNPLAAMPGESKNLQPSGPAQGNTQPGTSPTMDRDAAKALIMLFMFDYVYSNAGADRSYGDDLPFGSGRQYRRYQEPDSP